MRPIRLLHLYPDRMNIYGDFGNIIALSQRMEWRDIAFEYHTHMTGDRLTGEYDMIFMGGGQDNGQAYVAQDLQLQSRLIHDHFRANKPILVICGGYQLFGHYFITSEGVELPGIRVFNIATRATDFRMIGNIVLRSEKFGEMVGFENHSGATQLLAGEQPLGKVEKGYGNNQTDKTEGVFSASAIGTYLHGSFLPKNPEVADYLIETALQTIEPKFSLLALDDWLEQKANANAKKL